MRVFVKDLDREAEPGQPGSLLGKRFRVEHVGRLGHQITGEEDRLGGGAEGAISLFCGARRVGCDGDRGERRLLLGFLRRAVFVEAVGAQRGAKSEMGRSLCRLQQRRIAEVDREGGLALAGAVEMGDKGAAEILQQPGIQRIGLAEAGDDDAAEWQVGRADDRDQLVLLAVEPRRRGDRAADRAAVASSSRRAVASQRPLLPHADDDSARARRGEFGETDFHAGHPGAGLRSGGAIDGAPPRVNAAVRRSHDNATRRGRDGPKAVATRYPPPYDPPPMTSLDRYILRQCLSMMIFVTAALSAAVWLAQSLRLVDLIVNRGLVDRAVSLPGGADPAALSRHRAADRRVYRGSLRFQSVDLGKRARRDAGRWAQPARARPPGFRSRRASRSWS